MSDTKKIYQGADGRIVIENRHFSLRINENAVCESLILKKDGRELLDADADAKIFSLEEKRPFNNEIKLMYPNKRTTFAAKSVKLADGALVVHFDLVTFGARVEVDIKDEYVVFRLGEFIITEKDFCVGPTTTRKLNMDIPPVDTFRLVSLPVKRMENFGEWLNVTWDNSAAVAVIATMPQTRINHEKRGKGALMLTADAVRTIKLVGCSCALIVTEGKESMLDAIDAVECDFDLPRGVQSRRSGRLNSSALWTSDATPKNIDKYIEIAKTAGFSYILFYFTSFYKRISGYRLCANYDYSDDYPNGDEDVKTVLAKVRAAGLTPGIHFLQTHIGICSRYVTPVADHRLHLTRHFTLAKPLSETDTTVFVEEPTVDAPMHEDCRVLQFGGELIHYESYTDEPPYAFLGCKRGHFDTNVISHPLGQIGGTLDISEFGATSVYLNQDSSLADEIGDKLAHLYNLGFEFCYMDGSEGAKEPFDYHVSNAQYRVIKKFNKPPLFVEGAAKTHFGWHWLSGGNAFDTFPCDTFKDLIVEFPFEEARHMREDFTRVNFGWWQYYRDTQPDIYEFGTSRAAAFDCPVTMLCPGFSSNPVESAQSSIFDENRRTKDNLEVVRRWEEYRPCLTEEQKKMLRDPKQEHTLLKLEEGYALVPYNRAQAPAGITAYTFEYEGKAYATLWHKTGEGSLSLALDAKNLSYKDEFVGASLPVAEKGGRAVISVSDKAYLSGATLDAIQKALASAELL